MSVIGMSVNIWMFLQTYQYSSQDFKLKNLQFCQAGAKCLISHLNFYLHYNWMVGYLGEKSTFF